MSFPTLVTALWMTVPSRSRPRYVRTYLERDLRELSQVDSLIDFRRVMQNLPLRTGGILNQADVAKESQISHPTTHRYIKLIEVADTCRTCIRGLASIGLLTTFTLWSPPLAPCQIKTFSPQKRGRICRSFAGKISTIGRDFDAACFFAIWGN